MKQKAVYLLRTWQMCDSQSHQLRNKHTFGVFADTLEKEIEIHLLQLVFIVVLLGAYFEILWFEL